MRDLSEPMTKLIIFMIFDPHPTPVLRDVLGKLDLSEHDPAYKAETMRYMSDARTEAYTEDLLKLHAGLVRSVIIDILAMRNESKEGLN
jgi:hypothetical protein